MEKIFFQVTKVDNGFVIKTQDSTKNAVDPRTLLSEIHMILNKNDNT